jgi:hypothetical protein
LNVDEVHWTGPHTCGSRMSSVGGPMWKISAALTSPQICALETILHCPWTSTTARLRLKWRKSAQWKMWKIVRRRLLQTSPSPCPCRCCTAAPSHLLCQRNGTMLMLVQNVVMGRYTEYADVWSGSDVSLFHKLRKPH